MDTPIVSRKKNGHGIKANDHQADLLEWRQICGLIPLLFEEPIPGTIKH